MNHGSAQIRVDIEIDHPARAGEQRKVNSVLVDGGAALSWVPAAVLESLGIERYKTRRFRQASGAVLERWIGAADVHVAGRRTLDDIVFAQSADPTVLGARTLVGLNFRIDPVTKQLVDAGPAPAALAL